MLKVVRKIVSNGNSVHVSLPPALLNFLRWRAGDHIVIEAIDFDRVVVRQARIDDLRSPALPKPTEGDREKVPA